MANIDWNAIMNGQPAQRSRWAGANVKFMTVVKKNRQKSEAEGRDIYDEVPSISIRWPGGDETVRAIEEQDKLEHPAAYAAFTAGLGEVQSGMPLKEWTLINASAIHELAYLGFRTVEQLAEASDEVKRKLGPLGKFVKMAKDWMDAATGPQAEVVSLRAQLERERLRSDRLENQVELLLQRVEANEGTKFTRPERELPDLGSVSLMAREEEETEEEAPAPKKRGRPKKIQEG